jgi:hypothetical protein
MAKAGDPYENAVAERVNGILKYEFDLNDNFKNFNIAKKNPKIYIFIQSKKTTLEH